jgi:FixJ family two-component response regulator
MMAKRSLVSIVDDDESVRESLPDLLRQFGFAAKAFSSAEAFLASNVVSETSCLIVDITMPGMLGLIRFRGHFAKGGYDVHDHGRDPQEATLASPVR